MSSSQGISSSLISFEMIFRVLQSELFRFKFKSLSSKIAKIPEFNLVIAFCRFSSNNTNHEISCTFPYQFFSFQVAESEAHKDEVRNRVLSQRIKRLIQTGQYTPLKQENLEPVLKAKPLLLLKETDEPKGKNLNSTQTDSNFNPFNFYPF